MKDLLRSLKHPIFLLVAAIIGIAALVGLAGWLPKGDEQVKRPPTVVTLEGGAERLGRPAPPSTAAVTPAPETTTHYVEVAPITLDAPSNYQLEAISEYDLPVGTQIKVKLINTIENSDARQPVLLLVTDDVYNARGYLVIPAGTKAIGTAIASPQRDKVCAHETFSLVFADDSAMQVKAALLNSSHDNSGQHYGATDGAVGVEGFPFSQREWFKVTRWVRVPAGKQGYLLLLEAIDRAHATRGGAALPSDVQEAQHDREARQGAAAGSPLQALLSQPQGPKRPPPLLQRIFAPSTLTTTQGDKE